MFLNNIIISTSLRIWLQTQKYERVSSLPTLTNVDYLHINTDNVLEPFIIDTTPFKRGSIVLVKDPNKSVWDAYKITIQGNILKYGNIMADTYWNSLSNTMRYSTNFIEAFINNVSRIDKLPLLDQVKLYGEVKTAISRVSDVNIRHTYSKHFDDLVQGLLIRLYQDSIENPDNLKITSYVFSAKTLMDKLNTCPWLEPDDVNSIVLKLEANDGTFKAHNLLANSRPNMGQYLFGTIDGNTYILSNDFIYQYSKKSDKKMRLFYLL